MIEEVTVEEKVVGAGSKSNTDPSEVMFEKDKGLWYKSGRNETITVGDKTVGKGKDGLWALKKPRKQAPDAPQALAPHQSLRGLEKSSEITASDENEHKVYLINLQAEGAASLLGDVLRRELKKGSDEPKCTAKIWVKEGTIVKLEIACTFTIRSAKSPEEKTISIRRLVEFKEINSLTVEIPEEARKALEGGQ
jgi:hypothetical protein